MPKVGGQVQKQLRLACLGCFMLQPNVKKCVQPLMEPSSIMFGCSMKCQGKFCCLAFHGTPELHVCGFHERLNTRFLCLASNFWHQNLEAKRIFLRLTSNGSLKHHVWEFHERPRNYFFVWLFIKFPSFMFEGSTIG